MEYYENEIKERLDELVENEDQSREEILKRWAEGDTQDDFGNMTGSRFCSAYLAQEALKEAGFPWNDDLNDLLSECDYDMTDLLNRGAEVVDVIFCELIAPRVAADLLEDKD